MSSGGDLSTSVINLEAIKEYGSSELLRILDSHSGTKALVIDPALSGPLGLIIGVKLMKEHGVAEFYLLNSSTLRTNCDHVIYLIRPYANLVSLMIEQIKSRGVGSGAPQYAAYMVPRHTLMTERQIEAAGLEEHVTVGEYQLDLVPFDSDVLSLELGSSFRECFVDGDLQCLPAIVRSIVRLQLVCGTIPIIKGKGVVAHKVAQLLHRTTVELGDKATSFSLPAVESLLLLDRATDLVSALMPQMTYEGLLDETLGIRNNAIELDVDAQEAHKQAVAQAQAIGKPLPPKPAPDAPPVKRKHLLNSNDALFGEIRDLPFRVLGPLLHRKAEAIKQTYDERSRATSVEAMHEYWGRFKQAHREHALLQTHIGLAEVISTQLKTRAAAQFAEHAHALAEGRDLSAVEEYISALIYSRADTRTVYRLLLLMAVTTGVSRKRGEQWKRDLLQAYGFEELGVIAAIERMGLLPTSPQPARKPDWDRLRKTLSLVVPVTQDTDPEDLHSTYHHYAPLSARIAELASTTGALRKSDVLASLPGPSFEYRQALHATVQRRVNPYPGYSSLPPLAAATNPAGTAATALLTEQRQQWLCDADPSQANTPNTTGKPVCVVYFLGGVTMAEISALRNLSDKPGHRYQYVVATTKLVNGNTLVDALGSPLHNQLSVGGK